MNETELTHMADFLSIALEAMERENYDVAEDFVEDVQATVMEELNE
jgi:hypothetical protein